MTGTATAISDRQRDELKRSLLDSDRFRHIPAAHFETELGRKQLDDHVYRRHQVCSEMIVPWVDRKRPLDGAVMVEIGCGTGSSAAAFSPRVATIHAHDINDESLDAARRRIDILKLGNVTIHDGAPSDFIESMRLQYPGGVDVVLLYAVMEHQTLDERLETLSAWWSMLRPGGVIVVADTPNRLVYMHHHTSYIPFFDMLPDPLAFRFLDQSPRAGFRERMAQAISKSKEHATEALDRWGRGVSFHEFQAVLGDLRPLVVGDGFEPEIVARKQVVTVERLLLTFMLEAQLPVPIGFARRSVDIILRKPAIGVGGSEAGMRPTHDPAAIEPLPTMQQYRALRRELNEIRSGRRR